MKIAITGTPGTGKTTISKKLADLLNYKYIDLNKPLLKDFKTEFDEDLDTWEIDTDSAVEKLKFPCNSIIDGHLSHLFEVDVIVVLRCRPDVLAKRLLLRDWTKAKVEENVDAEGLNVISDEVWEFSKGTRIIEIDTSGLKVEAVLNEIQNFLKTPEKTSKSLDFVEFLPVNI